MGVVVIAAVIAAQEAVVSRLPAAARFWVREDLIQKTRMSMCRRAERGPGLPPSCGRGLRGCRMEIFGGGGRPVGCYRFTVIPTIHDVVVHNYACMLILYLFTNIRM